MRWAVWASSCFPSKACRSSVFRNACLEPWTVSNCWPYPCFCSCLISLLRAGVGKDLYTAVQSWIGHWPGGLGVATVLSCTHVFGDFRIVGGDGGHYRHGRRSGDDVARLRTAPSSSASSLPAAPWASSFPRPSLSSSMASSPSRRSRRCFSQASVPGLFLAGVFVVYSMSSTPRSAVRTSPVAKAELGGTRMRSLLLALPTVLLAVMIIGSIYTGSRHAVGKRSARIRPRSSDH